MIWLGGGPVGPVVLMVDTYRNIDGSGNNPADDALGTAGSQFLRIAPASYTDGYSDMSGYDRPSAREISNTLFAQDGPLADPGGASDFFWVWGQFIDHDIDLTRGAATTPEAAPVAVPAGDPWFDPTGSGAQTIAFTRSDYDHATGSDTPREQMNDITPYLDASVVYGSDAERAAALRADGGYMKVSAGDLLPWNDGSQHNEGEQPGRPGYLAGDVRANENAGLTSMQTLFVREHNRLVDELKEKHPDWDAETLYQQAKALVEGEIQAITYDEFLPKLVGPQAIADYSGYKADVDPQVANIFATAAYRFGHTMLSPTLQRVTETGAESEYGHLALRDAFFRPDKIAAEGGIEEVLRGLGVGHAQAVDTHVVDDVRNFLFGPPGAGGFDLVSLNIQRGRDHGLADYNSAREAFGLERVTDWSDITGDVDIQGKLQGLFGSVDNIDVWVGGLAEDPAADAMVGELFQAVIADQFTRIRDGDAYWYENRFAGEDLDYLNSVTLSDIVQANTGIEHLQNDVFTAYDRLGGTDGAEILYGGDGHDLLFGAGGDDVIYGGGEDDQLHGDAGNDELYGGEGDDVLYGGTGDDWLVGGEGEDELHGGDGQDALFGGAGDDRLDGGDGHDELYGGDGNDVLLGGRGHDQLYGGAGADKLNGGAGFDELYGGAGDDLLDGGGDDDWLVGGTGDDVLLGGDGDDALLGGAGDDLLLGGAGHDELYGGDGNDTLNGGEGWDILTGGAGADVFAFGKDFGNDTITDFNPALDIGDVLDLSGTGAAPGDVSITQKGCDTLITVGCAGAITLENFAAAELDPNQHLTFG